MSAGAISLESAVRTCKVDTAWANKIRSDRFLNPAEMVCPVWNGYDVAGRPVAPDSFVTKSAGCNSAEDRVVVENNVSRPQYMEYINLNANGVNGNIYGNTSAFQASGARNAQLKNEVTNVTGQFGYQSNNLSGNIETPCHDVNAPYNPRTAYARGMASQMNRNAAMMNNGMIAEGYRRRSGF